MAVTGLLHDLRREKADRRGIACAEHWISEGERA